MGKQQTIPIHTPIIPIHVFFISISPSYSKNPVLKSSQKNPNSSHRSDFFSDSLRTISEKPSRKIPQKNPLKAYYTAPKGFS